MPDPKARSKRRKLNHDVTSTEIPEHLETVEDLRSSLLFRQNTSTEVKHGITKFKEFLQSIVRSEDVSKQQPRLQTLKSYCLEQTQSQTTDSSCLRDLISSWSFTVEVGHDPLLSAIPSVLALFLKTISGHLEFRDLGLGLCKALLENDQLRLFDRGMTASKAKEHLISPCIRLLTEIVGFDGGSVAGRVFANRATTFKRMDLFLEQRKDPSDAAQETGEKPTLRRIAQRFILRNLAFQSGATKRELITEGKLLRAFLRGIRYDSPDIIADIIQAIEKHIINEHKLSRSIKSRFIDSSNLHSLTTLYRPRPTSEVAAIEPSISQRVHALLLKVCTETGNGLLMRQSGWYPPGFDTSSPYSDEATGTIDMGLDSPMPDIQFGDSSVANFKLARFLLSLHPDSDTLEGELILAIFQVAPELVANYFLQKSNFITDPKPTPEWLGQSAWLFHCIRLPIPENWGSGGECPSIPPPVPTVLENILPRPLDRAMLTRCMNLNVEVVTLFAIRALIFAFQKLREVMVMFTRVSSRSSLWLQAATKLKTAFGQRIPLTKDVIAVFQRNAKGIQSLRSSAMELVALYYELLPELAMSETFNISSALIDALSRSSLEKTGSTAADSIEELETLMRMALRFPQMRWWNKLEGQNLSCFTSILRAITVKKHDDDSVRELKQLLHIVAQDYGILGENAIHMDILVASTQSMNESSQMTEILEFLDNCLTRLAKAPVHYQDLARQSLEGQPIPRAPDLFIAAVFEQWPFICKNKDMQHQKDLAQWTAKFFGALVKHGCIRQDMSKLRKRLTAATDHEDSPSIIRKVFRTHQHDLSINPPDPDENKETEGAVPIIDHDANTKHQEPDLVQVWRSNLSSQLNPLQRRRLELDDLEEAIAGGLLSNLISHLCSRQEDVRLQGLSDLSRFGHSLQQTSDRSRWPLAILVGEIVETAKDDGLKAPFPSPLAEMGTKFADVLTDPLHFMYGKVNRFLNKGPVWERKKVLSYWIDRVILRDSERDDSKLNEITWLLGVLVHGLRTVEDLELYRYASVFERAMSLYDVAGTKDAMRERILELIFRAIEVGGGQMLVTRAGILTWLKIRGSALSSDQPLIHELLRQIGLHCSSDQLGEWKGTVPLLP